MERYQFLLYRQLALPEGPRLRWMLLREPKASANSLRSQGPFYLKKSVLWQSWRSSTSFCKKTWIKELNIDNHCFKCLNTLFLVVWNAGVLSYTHWIKIVFVEQRWLNISDSFNSLSASYVIPSSFNVQTYSVNTEMMYKSRVAVENIFNS